MQEQVQRACLGGGVEGRLGVHGGLALELKVAGDAQPILGQPTEALGQVPAATARPRACCLARLHCTAWLTDSLNGRCMDRGLAANMQLPPQRVTEHGSKLSTTCMGCKDEMTHPKKRLTSKTVGRYQFIARL